MGARHQKLLGGLILLAACNSAPAQSPDPAARAVGVSVTPLAGAKFLSLPTGQVYIRLVHFAQPPAHTVKSSQHVPGVVYVESGVHRLLVAGQSPQDSGSGEAIFLGGVTHAHYNPGPTSNGWYFIALWPSSARTQSLVDPTVGRIAYQTPDFDSARVAQGAYFQTLRLVSVAPGGRTAAHKFGGMRVLFVLEGSLTVHVTGAAPATVAMGSGSNYMPNVSMQELNPTADPTVFLELLTTGAGKPIETVLGQSPAGN